MRLKDKSVRAIGLHHRLTEALFIADGIWREHGQELVITSLVDSRHSRTSLHYAGCAADFRTRDFSDAGKLAACDDLRDRLELDFDVVLESSPESSHCHIEFQPKRPYALS